MVGLGITVCKYWEYVTAVWKFKTITITESWGWKVARPTGQCAAMYKCEYRKAKCASTVGSF